MTTYLLGDIHGDFNYLNKISSKYKNDEVIQLGDFGIGFGKNPDQNRIPDNVHFIHGNHDNHFECKNYTNYLGRFGIYNNMFFVSGAASIDKVMCRPGVDWWEWEELTHHEMIECTKLYIATKPNIIITHDVPNFLYYDILVNKLGRKNIEPTQSRTNLFLNNLFVQHSPKFWYAGHMHLSYYRKVGDTEFRVLNCNEVINV